MALWVCAFLASIALGIGIKTHVPALSHVVGNIFVNTPFWVVDVLSAKNLRFLSPFLRSVEVIALTALGLSIAIILFIVFRFAASGGSL